MSVNYAKEEAPRCLVVIADPLTFTEALLYRAYTLRHLWKFFGFYGLKVFFQKNRKAESLLELTPLSKGFNESSTDVEELKGRTKMRFYDVSVYGFYIKEPIVTRKSFNQFMDEVCFILGRHGGPEPEVMAVLPNGFDTLKSERVYKLAFTYETIGRGVLSGIERLEN